MRRTMDGDGPYAELCTSKVRAGFEIYMARYPDFVTHGSADERFRAWKHHIVTGEMYEERTCIIELPYLLITDLEGRFTIHFCGRFSGSPYTKTDEVFWELVSENRDHALLGKEMAMFFLNLMNRSGWGIELNPDVAYYIRSWLIERDNTVGELDLAELESQLSSERLDFVKRAVARSDLKSVLETTPACGPID